MKSWSIFERTSSVPDSAAKMAWFWPLWRYVTVAFVEVRWTVLASRIRLSEVRMSVSSNAWPCFDLGCLTKFVIIKTLVGLTASLGGTFAFGIGNNRTAHSPAAAVPEIAIGET